MWIEPGRRPFMKNLGHAGVWQGIPGSLSEQGRPGLPCCHTRSLLMRAAPHAFVLWEVTFLVWQVEVSRLLKGGQELLCRRFFFLFVSIMTRFAKEIRLRQKDCLQICSWEALPCTCHSSGLQFCPNAFYTTVNRLSVVSYPAWEPTRWSAGSPHCVLCRPGHACVGDSLALTTL